MTYYLGHDEIVVLTDEEAAAQLDSEYQALRKAGMTPVRAYHLVDAHYAKVRPAWLYRMHAMHDEDASEYGYLTADTYDLALKRAHLFADTVDDIVEVVHYVDGLTVMVLPSQWEEMP